MLPVEKTKKATPNTIAKSDLKDQFFFRRLIELIEPGNDT
jgi:hypothetical protein